MLWSVTCDVGSHSATCHSTQVNVSHFNPSQTGWYSIYLPLEGWKAELTWQLVIYPGSLPVKTQKTVTRAVHVLTGPVSVEQLC